MQRAQSTTSAASSGKRKRDTPMAFYAVKVGRIPGVYQTWNEANEQIQGFKGATYKKFATHAEADAMVRGTASATPKSGKTKYYGVAIGHVPGVYTDYSVVQAQLKGATGVKHKGFATHAEAQTYVDEFRRDKGAAIGLRGDLSDPSTALANTSKDCDKSPKKQKKESAPPKSAATNGDIVYEPGLGPLPPDAEDGFDPTLKLDVETGQMRVKTEQELHAMKIQPTGDFTGPIVVYTDGSSLGNGRANAVAGVGVYFGPRDARNISEALRGDRQTNQRAELTAVARALDHIPIDRSAEIVTDSNYAIKCLTEWFHKWEKSAWRNAAGKPVENRDLIEPIIARIRERDCCRARTMFRWIKGHTNDAGNCAADELAVRGSRTSTPELRSRREFSLTLNTPTRLHYFKDVAVPEQRGPRTEMQTLGPAVYRSEEGNQVVSASASGGGGGSGDDNDADFDRIFSDLDAEQQGASTGVVTSRSGDDTAVAVKSGRNHDGGNDDVSKTTLEPTTSLAQQQQQQQPPPKQHQVQDEVLLERLLRGELAAAAEEDTSTS